MNVKTMRTSRCLAVLGLGLAVLLGCSAELLAWNCGLVYTSAQFRHWLEGKDDLARYRAAIQAHGGRIVAFHPGDTPSACGRKMRTLDALLLPGGDDVDPELYGEDPHPRLEEVDRAMDLLELHLIRLAEQERVPTMGICKGLQVLNVALGGTLYQDLPSQYPKVGRIVHRIRQDGRSQPCFHQVYLAPGSLAWETVQQRQIETNSYHHQAINRPGRGLAVTGKTIDGVPEVVEKAGEWFVFAVQFHPEKMRQKGKPGDRFFAPFVQKAREFSRARKAGRRIGKAD